MNLINKFFMENIKKSSVLNFTNKRDRTGYIFLLSVLVLCILNLAGWMSDSREMRQISAFCFIMTAFAIFILKSDKTSPLQKLLVLLIGISLITVAFFSILPFVFDMMRQEDPFIHVPGLGRFFAQERMPFVTAILFILFGSVLLLLNSKKTNNQGVAHGLTLVILFTSYLIPVSYFLGIPSMYSVHGISVAFYAGICFCLLSVAILLFYPETWFMKVFVDKFTGGYMARRLLPGLLIVPLIVGWFRINGERAGLFSSDIGVVLLTVVYTSCFLLLLWVAAKPVIEIDKKQRALNDSLRQSEELYRNLVESANSMIMRLDKNGTLKFVNEYTLRFYGYTREEMIGKNVRMIIPEIESTGRTLDSLVSDILKHSEKYPQNENENIRKNGERAWVTWTNRIIPGIEGNTEILTIGNDITQRKKAEERLAYERELFEGIVENIPVMITLYDPELKNFRLNKALKNTIGWTEEDAADGNLLSKVYPEPGYRQKVTNYMQSLQPGWKELVMTAKDGSLVDSLWANFNLPNGVQIGIGIDIRERKKAEATLRENEQRLQAMFNNAAIGIVEGGEHGLFTNVNARACEILGYTREELLGKSVSGVTVPEDRPRSDEINKKIYSGQLDKISYEKQYIKKDGTRVWVDITISAVRDKEGKLIQTIGTMADISERKRWEEALKESEETFSAIVNVIPVGVTLSSFPDRRIYKVNPAWLSILGYSREEEVLGKNSEELGLIRDREHQKSYLDEFRQNEKVRNVEITIYTKTGSPRIALINLDQVHIRGQKYILATVEDITSQKAMEHELKNRNEELTRFSYTVSHDLKSPLVTIRSFTTYLKEDIQLQDKEAQDKDIMYIENAAEKMGRLLDELLELSRIGRKEDIKSDVPMRTIAQNAVDLVAGRISQRNVSVVFSGPEVMLYGHNQRLLQLYQNLIDNAVKFMGKQPDPVVEIGSYVDGNNEVVLFVRDNGAGIDPKYHHKVFGLFEKLDNSTEGSGIGLALIKRIVEVHNGTIWFTSEGKDKGTTFYFTLEGTWSCV